VLVAHQPTYLPWQGYFARLLDVGLLVFLDHVQFVERGWQNRTWIRGHHDGRQRLTVPVRRAGRFGQPIGDVEIAGSAWAAHHWRTLCQVYGHAPYFSDYAAELRAIYSHPWTRLACLDTALTELVLDGLGLPVRLIRSSTLHLAGHKTSMLIDLCQRMSAGVLRVGTGATRYLDTDLLSDAGITVEVISYSHPTYQQGRSLFTPGLSTLDALLYCGPGASKLLATGTSIQPWPQS
jgi:hypothetical protein